MPKFETRAETKPEPKPGKLIVMAPSERSWEREEFAPHVKADEPRETGDKRRLSAMAAVVAIAASVGAISGALATAGMMHFAVPAPAPAQVADTSALEILGCPDRCRCRRTEGECRAHLQDWPQPVQSRQ